MPETTTEIRFNGHSMVAPLRRVLLCSPQTAGWNHRARAERWRELGFRHAPDVGEAQLQHESLRHTLENSGAEVMELRPSDDLSLDAVYVHDASLPTDFGLIVMRPGKANRVAEGPCHALSCEAQAIPTFANITAPGTTQA